MARRITSKRSPKRRPQRKRKPTGFWQRLAHQFVRLRLDRIALGVLLILSLGIALGTVFSLLFEESVKVENEIPSELTYKVPVKVIGNKKVAPIAEKSVRRKALKQSKAVVAEARPKPIKPGPKALTRPPTSPKKTPLTHNKILSTQPATSARAPSTSVRGNPPWRRYAVHVPAIGDRPAIAIVLDDLGIDQRRTRRAIALPAPLTLALIPYGYNLAKHANQARARGHELLVHLPMEPLDPEANPGKNALLTSLTENELRRRVNWNMHQFQGFVGINNHMGSKFTAWRPGMAIVMKTLKRDGLLFLDSKTTTKSQGIRLARAMRVPHTVRDVFLDNNITREAIEQQLRQLENVARRNGVAIGIGHPHDETVAALQRWIPVMQGKGFVLVPVSAIVRRKSLSG